MKPHLVNIKTTIDKPLKEVFSFFSNAENLNLLTPPEVNFKILTPLPIIIEQGSLVDYRIKLSGITFYWRTEIIVWEPPFRFVDVQKKGPYQLWKHEHCFEEVQGKTIMTDLVEYLAPGWIFEPIINALYVDRKIRKIFEYRSTQITHWAQNSN